MHVEVLEDGDCKNCHPQRVKSSIPLQEQTTKFQVIPALSDYAAAICHNTKVTHTNIFRGDGKYEIRCDDFKLLCYK